ncbi:centrobin isoform X1 [Drosophila busckii]|nr:centrobin isoform X1 [Drosophila busckii]
MSDTDTDDTDLLLLIPPNYYSTNTDAKKMNHHEDAMAMPPPPLPTTAAYRFLQPSKKTELNHINARLQNIELERFEAPSDLSTISSSTVRSTLGNKDQRALLGLVHSTPKNSAVPPRDHRPEANILHEIDNYLDNNHAWSGQQHHSDDHLRMRGYSVMAQESQQGASSLPSIRLGSSVSAMQDNKLISLSELWGKSNMAGTVIAAALPANQTVLKEEQLRRQHLEKIIQTLQAQLLEYQQRISVALEVDRSKDAALHQAAESTKALNFEVQQLRDTVHQLNTERSESQDKQDALQYELAQAVSLTTKFQEKTEILEAELKQHKQQASETLQQQEQLQLQLAATKRNEELTYVELNKLRDRFAKMDYQQEKLNTRIEELEKDKSTLQQQKEMLQEYHQKQKARADNLESQRRSLQEALSNLTDIETNLKKKLDVQQKSLKQQYQQQMENVVAKKLQEFQGQLDKLEEQLKAEARERERLIAERAVKQLEMINEKNNQELNLILEKHNEEVELYRLQLANASKKIDELELKLA